MVAKNANSKGFEGRGNGDKRVEGTEEGWEGEIFSEREKGRGADGGERERVKYDNQAGGSEGGKKGIVRPSGDKRNSTETIEIRDLLENPRETVCSVGVDSLKISKSFAPG